MVKSSRGGVRPGAGRKPKYADMGLTAPVQFTLPAPVVDFIAAQADAADVSRSEWLTRLLVRRMKRRSG